MELQDIDDPLLQNDGSQVDYAKNKSLNRLFKIIQEPVGSNVPISDALKLIQQWLVTFIGLID